MVPKAAGAGVMFEPSFPILTALMAISSERGTPSLFFRCRDWSAMVETTRGPRGRFRTLIKMSLHLVMGLDPREVCATGRSVHVTMQVSQLSCHSFAQEVGSPLYANTTHGHL
jgi:hypothetical protein